MGVTVLVLAAGTATDESPDGEYPLLLTEFEGAPFVQLLFSRLKSIPDLRTTMAVLKEEISRHHFDDVVHLIDPEATVVSIDQMTAGATCTALLALDYGTLDQELLILNGDELLDIDYGEAIQVFRDAGVDSGTLVFDSVHPRYSYVRVSDDWAVLEAAEKRPISKNATAGFYWFRSGNLFLDAAKEQLRNSDMVDGRFYVCPVLNYLILAGKEVRALPIDVALFHPLKTSRQIDRFDYELESK